MSGYDYYWRTRDALAPQRNADAALNLSEERLNPRLRDADYLILHSRTEYFKKCLDRIPDTGLEILDVGGRLQPYRPLLEPRSDYYVAVDPQIEGLADVIGVAEHLPFADGQFDLVICAQVLSYVEEPGAAIAEIFRVLRPGGYLFLSVPANCPQFHDERWRFLHEGVDTLLHDFSHVEVCPEVYSLGGTLRTINKILEQSHSAIGKKIASRALIPLLNSIGRRYDGRVFRSEFYTANYSAFAQK
jgi:SAM-dependent methyltransferase